jgi:hypothetical protein
MRDLVLFESHVKHINYLPWLRISTPYIEALENRGTGTVKGDTIEVNFTNSYGNPGVLKAKVKSVGRLWIVHGKAYGYQSHPEGRWAAAVVWRTDEHFKLIVPSSNGEFLSIKIKYYETSTGE